MKGSIAKITLLVFIIFSSGAFARLNVSGDEAVVKIDGQEIKPEGMLEFKKDDTVWLEATGIKPNSAIHFKIKKGGVSWIQDDYDVDESGEVKGVISMPDTKIKVSCTVEYYSSSGTYHEVKFKFRTV